MVKFKCTQTGNVYSFEEHDAKGMRQHPDYEELKEEVAVEEEAPKTPRKQKGQ